MEHFVDIILCIFGIIVLICAIIAFIPIAILFLICFCCWIIVDYMFGLAGELLNKNVK